MLIIIICVGNKTSSRCLFSCFVTSRCYRLRRSDITRRGCEFQIYKAHHVKITELMSSVRDCISADVSLASHCTMATSCAQCAPHNAETH